MDEWLKVAAVFLALGIHYLGVVRAQGRIEGKVDQVIKGREADRAELKEDISKLESRTERRFDRIETDVELLKRERA